MTIQLYTAYGVLGIHMDREQPKKLTPEQIRIIEQVTSNGDRVEIVPVKDGLKLLRTRREVLTKPASS